MDLQKGLHLLMDREHYRTLPVERRASALLAYIEATRAGECPIKTAANLIIKEFKS